MERIGDELHLTEEESLALDVPAVYDISRAVYLHDFARAFGRMATMRARQIRKEAVQSEVDVCEYIASIHAADVAKRVASEVGRIVGIHESNASGYSDQDDVGDEAGFRAEDRPEGPLDL